MTKIEIQAKIRQIKSRAEQSRSEADRIAARRQIAALKAQLEIAPSF